MNLICAAATHQAARKAQLHDQCDPNGTSKRLTDLAAVLRATGNRH